VITWAGLQVLVEGPSKKDAGSLTGRTCTNKRVRIVGGTGMSVPQSYADVWRRRPAELPLQATSRLCPGDYAAVEVIAAGAVSLEAIAIAKTSLREFVGVHGATMGPFVGSDVRGRTPLGSTAVLDASVPNFC
jgi:hypothetical protein